MANLMESLVGRQLKSWQQQKAKLAEKSDEELSDKEQEPMPFISISREYGCGGFEIASIISEKLNNEYKAEPPWAAYDKNILEQLSSDMGLSTELAETLTADARNQITELFSYAFSNLPSQLQVYKKLAEIVRTLATKGNVIIVGRGGNILTQDMKGGLQVKIVAPFEWRVSRTAKRFNMSIEEARKTIMHKTKNRKSVFNEVIKYDIMNPNHYHIVINNFKCDAEEAAHMIIEMMKIKGLLKV